MIFCRREKTEVLRSMAIEIQDVAVEKKVQSDWALGAGLLGQYDVRQPTLNPTDPKDVPALVPEK